LAHNSRLPGRRREELLQRKNNLGDCLEELVTWSCEQYYHKRIAVINKIPTPYKIIGKDTKTSCLLAVPETKSTVDYIGEYKGIPFAMEAKKTQCTTRYTMDSWNDRKGTERNQRSFLEHWQGLRYYLISFWTLGEHYLVPFAAYKAWHDQMKLPKGRKSIPLSWFRENLVPIPEGGRVVLDFLSVVDIDKDVNNNFTKELVSHETVRYY
jgi:recombination protein U